MQVANSLSPQMSQNSSDNDADDDGDIITISHALSIIMSQPDSQFWVSKYIILFGLI